MYDFGSLYAGESASAHFRLRNTSGAPATLSVLAVAGVGFTLTSPSLPVGLAPQGAVDLSVTFRATDTGAYSASLHSEGIAILLTATVAPRLTYRVDPSGAAAFPGHAGFRKRGARRRRRAPHHHPERNAAGAHRAGDLRAGRGFRACGDRRPPARRSQPRQGGEFTIVFTPQTTGVRQGSLTLGDRSYPLLGTGVDPPLPKPTVSLDLKQAASAQQGR